MAATKPEDIRNIAVIGHKGSGKTSLVEAILYLAKVAPRRGKPGDRSCGLDDSPEEKAHMATLESRLATLTWGDKKINLLDTPGEASLLADTRMALGAVDGALLVVSGKSGVETGTERLFRWVRESQLPCLIVITKTDDEHARIDEIVEEIGRLKAPIGRVQVPVGAGSSYRGVISVRTGKAWLKPEVPGIEPSAVPDDLKDAVAQVRGKLVDDVAGTDDALADKYLTDGDLTDEDLDRGARKAVASGKLVPLLHTSSALPNGIAGLLNTVVRVFPSPAERAAWKGTGSDKQQAERAPSADPPVSALVFKTHIDPHAGKTSYLRVLSGVLRPDAQVIGSSGERERVAQLMQGVGKDAKPLLEAVAGDLVFTAKLKHARTGDTLSDEKHPFTLALPNRPLPLYSRSVQTAKGSEEKVAMALQRLVEEDPGLSFSHQEESRELIMAGLGAMQLEIALERLRRRSGIDCKLGPPRIPYRETITRKVANVEGKQKKQTGGHGQFGVCYVDLEPLPRGSGFVFEDAIVGGVIPRQFIPSVEKGVTKAVSQGVLAGYPVVDVKVKLVDGKYHSVDSSDAAFQVAGFRAFRAAAAAGAHPVLLEPIVKMEVTVPSESMGDVVGDLNSRHGKVLSTNIEGDTTTISAYVPLAQTLEYEPVLTGMTRGRGTFTLAVDHYDFCPPPVQEKIVRESGFKAVVEED
jgi:elongation factor G